MVWSLKCLLSYSVSVHFRWWWWFFPWHGFWFSGVTRSGGQCGHLYLSSNAGNGVAKLNEVPTKKNVVTLDGAFSALTKSLYLVQMGRCLFTEICWRNGFKTGSLRSSRRRLEIILGNSWHRYFPVLCLWLLGRPFCGSFLCVFPWFRKCSPCSFVGSQACFVLWQLLLAATTFEALVRILPGRNQNYQCWMILAPKLETNWVCFGHCVQALLALRNAMKEGFLMLLALLPTEQCMLRNLIGYFASCHLQMGI